MPNFSAVAIRLRSGYWRIHTVSRGLLVRDTWRRIGQVDVLILCHDFDRALTIDCKAYSQLLDPVREELIEAGHVVGVVAHRFSVLTGEKAHGSPHSCNRASLVSAVANRLARFVPWMRIRDGVSETAIRFWEKLLSRTKAKVVLLIGAPPELCVAGHRRGIQVVELLHGFRFGSIPWGYDLRSGASLPSHILALDDLSLETFESLRSRSVQTFKVEHPSVGKQQSIKFESAKTSDWLSSEKWNGSGGSNLLVALSPGYCDGEVAGAQFPNGLFPEALVELVRDADLNLNWIFRLHPVQLRNPKYRKQISVLRDLQQLPNVLDFNSSQGPLAALLSISTFLLTPHSSIADEALSKGVPTVFYDSDPSVIASLGEQYQAELANGEVYFWNWREGGLEEIIAKVRLLPQKDWESKSRLVRTCSQFVVQLLCEKKAVEGGSV